MEYVPREFTGASWRTGEYVSDVCVRLEIYTAHVGYRIEYLTFYQPPLGDEQHRGDLHRVVVTDAPDANPVLNLIISS